MSRLSQQVRRGMLAIAGVVLYAGLTATGASAQVLVEQEGQILYAGNSLSQGGIKIGSWGGGICKEVNSDTKYLEITPRGLYEGGRIDFLNPVDISSTLNDPNGYIQIMLLMDLQQNKTAGTLFGNPMGGLGGGMIGGGMIGGGLGGGMIGGAGVPGMGGATGASTIKPNKRIQIMVTLDSGEVLECQSDLSNYKMTEGGDMPVSFPFSALKARRDVKGTKLTRLVICGDGAKAFGVREVRTVTDSSPLRVDAGDDKEAARNYKVVFQGYGTTGVSAVKYSWDFDASDGIQEEAVGEVIQHKFTRSTDPANDLVVTLTVSDVFGIKEPASSTVRVRVND